MGNICSRNRSRVVPQIDDEPLKSTASISRSLKNSHINERHSKVQELHQCYPKVMVVRESTSTETSSIQIHHDTKMCQEQNYLKEVSGCSSEQIPTEKPSIEEVSVKSVACCQESRYVNTNNSKHKPNCMEPNLVSSNQIQDISQENIAEQTTNCCHFIQNVAKNRKSTEKASKEITRGQFDVQCLDSDDHHQEEVLVEKHNSKKYKHNQDVSQEVSQNELLQVSEVGCCTDKTFGCRTVSNEGHIMTNISIQAQPKLDTVRDQKQEMHHVSSRCSLKERNNEISEKIKDQTLLHQEKQSNSEGKMKVQKFVKSGQITDSDRLFNDLAVHISDKYFEIGTELGLPNYILKNELETGKYVFEQGNKKAMQMLQLWKDRSSVENFTYSKLAAALEKFGFHRHAHEYCYNSSVCTGMVSARNLSLDYISYEFILHLETHYASLATTHPNGQIDFIWHAEQYFELAMIMKQQTCTPIKKEYNAGTVDDLHQTNTIELKKLFKSCEEGKRKVVLIEGAPGCGKSTLSLYIAQQISKVDLFDSKEFQMAIVIQLRNITIQKAKSLADLLPCKSSSSQQMVKQAAMEICDNYGRGIIFILDGWDELPQDCRSNPDSIFRQIIQTQLHQQIDLHKSAVIITSRPGATGELQHLASLRVEIIGFDSDILMTYLEHAFTSRNFPGSLDHLQKLVKENPSFEGIVSLPLNASIMVYLYRKGLQYNFDTVTQYRLFSELIRNIIYRKAKSCCKGRKENIPSLSNLPCPINEHFCKLCKLAYKAVKGDCKICSLPPDLDCLGLMYDAENSVSAGMEVTYNFAHTTIKELLAAHHINNMSSKEQAVTIEKLFNEKQFTMVFRFYAGITEFKTPMLQDCFIRLATNYGTSYNPTEDNKSLLLSVIHCLYESQNNELCILVAKELRHGLNLRYTALTPSDCLCIGYFLACVCTSDINKFKLDLDNCSVNDSSCKYLTSGLREKFRSVGHANAVLSISLKHNNIGQEGCNCISSFLEYGSVINLKLNCNPQSLNFNNTGPGLPWLTIYLQYNTTLRTMCLDECGLNNESESIKHLSRSLKWNKHLKTLSLQCNNLHDTGIKYLADALEMNDTLEEMDLSNCGVTDVGLGHLASSLVENNSLLELTLHNIEFDEAPPNSVTIHAVSHLTEYLSKNQSLTWLVLPIPISESKQSVYDTIVQIQTVINESRKQKGHHNVIEISVDGVTIDEVIEYREKFQKAFKDT